MQMEKGSLSIESENMFPIIKKWLYSDHDIFVRELVSNGCDAITKLKKLEVMGEYDFPEDYKASIQVEVSPEHKTLSFTDTGIGMTEAEVKEYINQVAFSGATDFLEKYKDKTNEDQIIGHFGLGFYSAFMVADKVTIDTLSWQKDAVPVHWESEGGINFEMFDGDKKEVGTKITLYLSEDSVEFANEYRIKEIIEKYCSFMPVNIYLSKEGAEQEYETIDAADIREDDVVVEKFTEEAKTEEKENENGEKEPVEISPAKEKAKINKRPVSLSDTTPLWMKHPNECTDEEYKSFYRKVSNDYKEPLFWIHLNMDYPFNLKGILYFPKVNTQYDNLEGVIKLYNNQVFIADNIKKFQYLSPDFIREVAYQGRCAKPVGYGVDSITAICSTARDIENAAANSGSNAINIRRNAIRSADMCGIIATPANSSYNELVQEAARLSIMNNGAFAVIDYHNAIPEVRLK